MEIYRTRVEKVFGTDYHEVMKDVFLIFRKIKRLTKRRPYIKSAYFKKEKIFMDYFWEHLKQKSWKDRTRRLKYYPCAIDLIKNSKLDPVKKVNPNRPSEDVYRFAGQAPDGSIFYVQIKEKRKSKQKCFISVYPEK